MYRRQYFSPAKLSNTKPPWKPYSFFPFWHLFSKEEKDGRDFGLDTIKKKKKKGKSTHHGWGKEEQRGRWQRNSSSSGTRERNACPVRIYFPLLVYPRENSQLFNLLTQNSSLFLNKYFQFWHFYTRESNLSCLYTESTISEAYCLVSIYNSDISVPKIIHFHVFLLIHQ